MRAEMVACRFGWAVVVTAALLLCAPALAADEWDDLRTVVFGGVEAGPSSWASVGAKRALGPSLDRDGWLLLSSVGGGVRPERVDGASAVRVGTLASGLVGHQWIVGRTVVAVFGGAEIDHKQLLVAGAPLHLAEPRFGGRLQAELWSHPTDATLVTATLVAGSARGHVWGRASWGHEVWQGVYVGPEAVAYLQDDYREGRLGLHLTGLSFGGVTFGVSAGGSFTDARTGGYVAISGHVRR